MEAQSATEGHRDLLVRIVAILLGLAVLAERASGLPHPVRCLVLWILRPAEAIAREFVAEETQTPWPAFAEFPALGGGSGTVDALRLAARFRRFAAALRKLAREACNFARQMARLGSRRFVSGHLKERICETGLLSVGAIALVGWRLQLNDTS